jgi:Arc/MetJ-type ribon-helix-helix transcriptional regulator
MEIIEIDMKQTRTVTLRVSNDLNEKIEKIVKEKGYRSKSDFIRTALNEFLAEYEKITKVSSAVDKSWRDGKINKDIAPSNPNLIVVY